MPIHKKELKKFIPLGLIFFAISYNQSLLRGIKDMIILQDGSASTLYYLKLFCVMPFMVIFAIIYDNLSFYLTRNDRFYIIVGYFSIFFLLFLTVILPNKELLQINTLYELLKNKLPKLTILWEIIKNWHTSLFYIHAEAWGAYALGVAFWTFTNDITSLNQSKRFYSILAIISNIGGMIAGLSLLYVFKGNFQLSLLVALLLTIAVLLIFRYLTYQINLNPANYSIKIKDVRKSIIKVSFFKSIVQLFKSKYLIYIALIVVSYGLCISLFEAVWKINLVEYSHGNKDFLAKIYGFQMMFIGLLSIILSTLVSLSSKFMKKRWIFMAYFTPFAFLFAVITFFSFVFWGHNLYFIFSLFDMSVLQLSVIIGLINIVFIKSGKYSFFDTSKESAYIPLKRNLKIRGKAVIDGVGMVFGKGLGAIIVTFLSIYFRKMTSLKYPLAFLIFVFTCIWIFCVSRLYNKFKKYNRESNKPQIYSKNLNKTEELYK